MKKNFCHLLDDYLDADLTTTELSEFEAHLEQCVDCHEAVKLASTYNSDLVEAWSLIRPTEIGSLKDALPKTKEPTGTANLSNRNRKTTLAIWSTVAVVLFAAFGLWVFIANNFDFNRNNRVQNNDAVPRSQKHETPTVLVAVIPKGKDFINPIESNDEFTLVTYYQGYKPETSTDAN